MKSGHETEGRTLRLLDQFGPEGRVGEKHEMLTPPPPSHLGMQITFLLSCSSDLSIFFKLKTQSV